MEKSSVVFLLAGLIEPLGPDMPEQECEQIILYYVAVLVVVAQAISGSVLKQMKGALHWTLYVKLLGTLQWIWATGDEVVLLDFYI